MLKLKTRMTLPAVGLTGFEAPLGEEEAAIQGVVHQFAKNVLRPIGQELDRMSAEEVCAPGSPYWSVFEEFAKLRLGVQRRGGAGGAGIPHCGLWRRLFRCGWPFPRGRRNYSPGLARHYPRQAAGQDWPAVATPGGNLLRQCEAAHSLRGRPGR